MATKSTLKTIRRVPNNLQSKINLLLGRPRGRTGPSVLPPAVFTCRESLASS